MHRSLASLFLVPALGAAPLVLTVEPAPAPEPAQTSEARAREAFAAITPDTRDRLRASYQKLWQGNEALVHERVQQAVRVAFLRGMILTATGQIRNREQATKAFFPVGCEFQRDLSFELSQRVGKWFQDELMPVLRPILDDARRSRQIRRAPAARPASAARPTSVGRAATPAESSRHLVLEVDP